VADGWRSPALDTAVVSGAADGWQRLVFNERGHVGGSDLAGRCLRIETRAQVAELTVFTLPSCRPEIRSDGLSSVGLAVVRMAVRTVHSERMPDR
jgi:hypothetical protein